MPTKLAHTAPIALPGTLAYPVVSPYVALDKVFVFVSYETGPAGSSSVPGFTLLGSVSGGAGFCDIWYRDMAGGESGNIGSVTATGMANPVASAVAWRGGALGLTVLGTVNGNDAVSDLAYAATTGNADSVAAQMMLYVLTLAATSTRTARTLTQTGATLGTLTAYFGAGTGITQEVGERPVTTGVQAVPIANTYTLGTATTGVTGVLLLQDTQVISCSWTGTPVALTSSNTTFSVDITAAPTGDWVYCTVVLDAAQAPAGTAITMTGWTRVIEGDETTSSHYAVFRRKKVGGDTTFPLTWPTSCKGEAGVIAYHGLDPTTPDEGAVVNLHTSGLTYPTASATPSAADRWAWTFTWSRTSTAGNKAIAFTPPAGLLERTDFNNSAAAGSPWTGQQVSDSAQPVTAAAHTYTATQAFSETHGGAVLLYLIPAGSAVTLNLGNATETDAAQAVTLSKVSALGAAPVLNTAQQLALTKTLQLGAAGGTHVAQQMAFTKQLLLGVPTDLSTAPPLALLKALGLSVATETDAARTLTSSKLLTLGRAQEADTARPVDTGVPAVNYTPARTPTASTRAGDRTAATRSVRYTAVTRTVGGSASTREG